MIDDEATTTVATSLSTTPMWPSEFVDLTTRDARRRLAAGQRRYMSGPNRYERQIARLYRIPPHALGLTPPPLAINGHAYHQRQRNRAKRRRR